MKRKTKKWLARLLTLALVLTSVNLPAVSREAKAAALTLNEDEYDATDLLTKSGDILTSTKTDTVHVDNKGAYDGGIEVINTIQPIGKTEALTAKYLKITYTISDISSLTDESKLFIFQPYTSGWEGWQENFIKFKDAIENADGSYTSYISVRSIKESMSMEQECSGINLGFCSSEPTITLTGYYALTVKPTKTAADKYDTNADAALDPWEDIIAITGPQMAAAGLNVDSLRTATKVSITPYIQVTKAHTKSLIVFSTLNKSGSSNKALVGAGYEGSNNGASATNFMIHCGYGTGKEGTGIGAAGTGIYNKIPSLDTTSRWNGTAEEDISLRLQVRTKETDCKLLGVVFSNGQSFTVNEDGTITKGFTTTNIKTESQTPDSTDVKLKTEAEKRAEAEDELWLQIRRAKIIKVDDCLTEDLFNDLKNEITAAQAVLDATDATSTSLTAALSKLQNAVKNATNEPPMGLKKAIDYCESLEATDYSATSFAKLAPAIEAAKKVFEVRETKTDNELKAARDALEKVRVALVPNMSTEESNPKDFRILGKSAVVKEMGAGINLGNTMDGGLYTVSETSWQAYKTTKEYIKALHDAGYNTVRIPVTWGEHINDDYTIKEAWISRVQEIVDYCVDQDMYAVINIHHDGAANHDNRGDNTPACWLDTYQWNIEKVYQKYQGVWKTIANRFKDYDEHLIFESMNEVTDAHGTATNEDDAVLNALNQLFINTVRATGSNNTKRWLAITGRFATTNAITTIPEDTLADKGEVGTTRLMFAVHIYKDTTKVRRTYNELKTWQDSLSNSVKAVWAFDTNKEMPLYVGEYGVNTYKQDGSATGYNNAERALDYEFCAAVADSYGAVPMVWEQGSSNYINIETQEKLFADWNRPNLKPIYDDVVFGTIRGTLEEGKSSTLGTRMETIYKSYGHSSTSDNSVSKDPTITKATDITLSSQSVKMKAGERTKLTAASDSSRDIVLWSTDDDSIATVYNGTVHGKAAGITTIYAKSQSGSVEKEIQVIVTSNGNETAKDIKTEKPYYKMTEGDTLDIVTTLTPADSKDAVTYTSSNTDIATVSGSGRVTAENAGMTYIIVKAASGVSTIVAIEVQKKATSGTVGVTLNALFATSGLTVKSKPVTIKGDGQYTATLDLATDITPEATKAGITKLEDLTAIFLRDTNTLKPVVSQAYVRYDKVVVNNTELTLKKLASMDAEGFKNLLKENGQLDSNDPINGWDGCAVEGVTVNSSKHSVSFNNITNPTKISLTFTIKDMKFFPGKEKEKEATKVESVTADKIVIPEAGESKEIELKMTPADTDSEVTFYSTDSSVAVVNNAKQAVDGDGKVKVTVTALSEGTVTLVGITENGLKVLYTIGVGNMSADDLDDPEDPTPEGLDGSLWKEEEPEPTGSPKPSGSPKPLGSPTASASPTPTSSAKVSASPTPTSSAKVSASPTPTSSAKVSASPKPSGSPGSSGSPEPSGSSKPGDSSTSTEAPTIKAPAVNPPVEKGANIVSGKLIYKVTKAATTKTTGTLTVTALSTAGKNASSLSIPATTTIRGYKYKVTKLGNNVFKNAQAKSITLGKNITAIPKAAFINCKKLSTLTVKGKLKSVKKGAFKGCKKKIKVKGGSKKNIKANMKALKKSGYKKFK